MEDLSFNFITETHAEKLKNSCVVSGDVVFTHAGNIGQVSLIHEDAAYEKYVLSQRQFFLRCDETRMVPVWITYFFRSSHGQHLLLANASQVGVPSIARPVSYLRSIQLVVPPIRLLLRFAEVVDPLHKQVIANRTRIQSLSLLRDTLLPRLLSGQLRLPEAEALLQDAA
jgi:type I restriction enzyme S subunit